MASRKEQKEALRREREERERQTSGDQRKRLVGYGVAGAIVLIAVVVIAIVALGGSDSDAGGGEASVFPDGGSVPTQEVTDYKVAAADAGCTLKSVDASGASDHTTTLEEKVKYGTNPPTSGRHYQTVPDDGAYATPLSDEEFVHNLEHGRIIIWMKPTLSEEQRANLKALFDEDTYQMVITPRQKMPYAVAASAWNGPDYGNKGRLLLCKKYSPQIFDAIRSFRDENRSKGPEPVP